MIQLGKRNYHRRNAQPSVASVPQNFGKLPLRSCATFDVIVSHHLHRVVSCIFMLPIYCFTKRLYVKLDHVSPFPHNVQKQSFDNPHVGAAIFAPMTSFGTIVCTVVIM